MPTYDWVVQNESWADQAVTLQYDNYLMLPLLTPHMMIEQRWRLPEVYNGTTAVTVQGVVDYHLYPAQSDTLADLFVRNYMTQLNMAIIKRPVDPELPFSLAVDPTYDLRRAPTANEQWVWQRSVKIANIVGSVLAGTPTRPTAWQGSVLVRTKSQRRLSPLEGLWLYIQWGRLATAIGNAWQDLGPGSDVEINVVLTPRVRTLVRLPWR